VGALILASWCAAAAAGPAVAETRDLYPNTPDDVIRTQAARQAKPLWQVPLGPALAEDMLLLGPDRLLVALRKDFPGLPNLDVLVVDTATGRIVWRFARDGVKGDFDRLLALGDLLLYRVQHGRSASLLALDPRTGAELWKSPALAGDPTFLPHPGGGCVLVIQRGDAATELTALDLDGGATLWRTSFAAPRGAGSPQVLLHEGDVVTCFDHLRRLSARDGRVRWARPELRFDEASPPPEVEGDALWVVDANRRLHELDAATGAERWSAQLPAGVRYSQVYPLGGRLYLRGLESETKHFIASVSPRDGRVLWTHALAEASVSNLVEHGGTLCFGTPGTLVALDAVDGRQRFAVKVTTTGRAFPVRIRQLGERIAWVGELVVAAFDAANGRLVYRQGMTPGAQELHLNGLDAAAPSLKEELRRSAGPGPGHALASGMASAATSEMLRYQALSRTYDSKASIAKDRGDALGYNVASLKGRLAAHEARLQAWSALALNVVDLAMVIRQVMQAGALRTFMDRQVLFRKSILSAHVQAESDAFVHRPHLVSRDPSDTFSLLSIVNLGTGKRTDTALAPQYLSYGLWQVVDFEKQVAYHVHIGMDPAAYELGDARAYYPYSKARTIGTFLIAQPVTLPR